MTESDDLPGEVIADIYPVTIIRTRYGGVYEGGRWAAFNLYPDQIPEDATGGDTECAVWWNTHDFPVGVASAPTMALIDLADAMATWHEYRSLPEQEKP